MLSVHSDGVGVAGGVRVPLSERRRPGAVCFVACERDDGGLGGCTPATACALAARGWRVHVLDASSPSAAPGRLRDRLARAGVGFSALGDPPDPPHVDLNLYHFRGLLHRAERVRAALEALHARERFDLIEFAE